MSVPYYIYLPVVGGIYGAFVGGYFHSKKRSTSKRVALIAGGVLLALLCVVACIDAFA